MSKGLAFSAEPPARNGESSRQDIESFVSEADVKHNATRRRPKAATPGEYDFLAEPHNRRVNIVNVRLSDREKAALKYIEEHSPDSMHAICLRVVVAEIDRRLKELTGRELGRFEG
jgi:hypothetical protein